MSEKKAYYKKKNELEPVGSNEFGKLPPQALELEEDVLGGCLIEKGAVELISDFLKPEMFYNPTHQKVFDAILKLDLMNSPVDMHTVTEMLRKNGTLEMVGGPYFITLLTSRVSSTAHIVFHAQIILQKYLSRELIRLSNEVQMKAFEEKEDVRNEAGEIVSEKIMEPKSFELTSAQMKDILNYNAASAQRVTAVAGTVIGYYVDKNGFITYDSTACLNNLTLSDVKAFMPNKMMELCQVFTGEKVKFELLPSIVRVTSGNDELTYKLQDSSLADNYPVAQIRSLAEREFTGSCKVNKSDLLNALDRLSLFIKIGPTQILARLRLIFEKDKLTLFDPYGKNIEVLKTADVAGLESFTQDIDLTYFKSLLSCHERDNLQLSYGNDVGIMITDNNIVQLIPYLEEDPSLANTVSTEYNDNEDASFASIAHSDDDEETVSLSDIATEDTYTFEG